VELDHVLIAVHDLAAAARDLRLRHGLASVEGGRHPGWGTENRIVPLGDAYLELVAVVDEVEAARSPFGAWIAKARGTAARPLGWAVRTGHLDEVCRRLSLIAEAGSRETPNGGLVRWRTAGTERAAAERTLPFFIEWGEGTLLPGRAPIRHPAGEVNIVGLQLQGDVGRLRSWLGDHELPITVSSGKPALARIVLRGAAGEIVLD
jgi:hypothetical protein